MKKILFIAAVATAIYVAYGKTGGFGGETTPTASLSTIATQESSSAIQAAFNGQRSGVQVQGEGIVSKLLADDNDGSRHQRFILTLSTGQTILVAHNIDLAPRVSGLNSGDTVAFYGVYEWNAKGGVVHWTHHDPAGRHVAGWLKHEGQTYQ